MSNSESKTESSAKPKTKQLLSIVEQGGYPDLKSFYQNLGYEVTVLHSMRKAMSFFKKNRPAIVVAEFNVQSDFRDRTSNLESLLATVEQSSRSAGNAETTVIVFYEQEFETQLEKLKAVFQNFHALPFPIEHTALRPLLLESDS